jgi:hypothetical protein
VSRAAKGADCKSAGYAFAGSSPASPTTLKIKVNQGFSPADSRAFALTTNWIVSIEYLHVDLGSIAASGLVTSGNANTAIMNFSTTVRSDLVRGGVAYKF